MKHWYVLLFALIVTACASPAVHASGGEASLPDLGPAPDLVGDTWLNSPRPLRLADLHGKVVLVDMWTFGCVNCRRTISSLRGWHQKYSSQGLVVIGDHFPEFDYESKLENLKQAVIDLGVPYPVVQDNAGINWNAYHTEYWPTVYLIDKNGHLRYTHIGEGDYTETESAIRLLLSEAVQQ